MRGSARVQLPASLAVIGLLTPISTLGSFATSVYRPSMPAIGVEFAATPAAVQATLTTFLASFAAVQLLFGPLSDRYGRRPVLAWGFAIYIAGSLACAMAASVGLLAAARVL